MTTNSYLASVLASYATTATLSNYTNTTATQSWVTANFISPLNPGTVAVNVGLSATMTANSFLISVDENTDERTKFRLKDSNNIVRNITGDKTVIHVSSDEANGSFINWQYTNAAYVNGSGEQLLNVPMCYLGAIPNPVSTGTYDLSIELKAGSVNELVFDSISSLGWSSPFFETKFTGLTNSWQTFTASWSAFSNGTAAIHLGLGTISYGGTFTQATSSVYMRNISLITTTGGKLIMIM